MKVRSDEVRWRPSQVQLIFGRRVTRRTAGRFRTRVLTEGLRSPFTPLSAGGPEQWLPANATPFWQNAIDIVLANPDAAALLPLEGEFRWMTPGVADVGSILALLNTGARTFDAISHDQVRDIPITNR